MICTWPTFWLCGNGCRCPSSHPLLDPADGAMYLPQFTALITGSAFGQQT
jgi:hypothetical protein